MNFSNFTRRVLLTFISVKLLLMISWIEHIKLSTESKDFDAAVNLIFGTVSKNLPGDGVGIGIVPCNDNPMLGDDDDLKNKCHATKSFYYIANVGAVCLVMLTALYTDYQENMTRWKTASLVLPIMIGVCLLIMLGISAHFIDNDFPGGGLAFDGFVYALYMVVLCGAYVAGLLKAPSGGEDSLKEAFL